MFTQPAQRVSEVPAFWTPGLLVQEGADAKQHCLGQCVCGIAVVTNFSFLFVFSSVYE